MHLKNKSFSVSPAVLIVFGWMLFADRSGIGVITLLAAALHECGHLFAARLLHIPPRALRLDLLGARIEVDGYLLSYGEEWLLCAAGPIVSLLASALAAPLWSISFAARVFSCASLVLGLLNLLPIRTFDGGRMLECMLCRFGNERVAERCMMLCSFLFLFLLWATAVYFLLRAGDGLSLFCFSMSLFLRFFAIEDAESGLK